MTVKEFYDRTGGDYSGTLARFSNEKRLLRFVRLFSDDPSFREVERYLSEDRLEEAFLAAHTLKGVCLNIGFTGLYKHASDTTEALRERDPEKARACFSGLKACFNEILEYIAELEDSSVPETSSVPEISSVPETEEIL